MSLKTNLAALSAATAIATATSAFANEISVHIFNPSTAVGSGQTAGAPGAASNGTWNNWNTSSTSATLTTVLDSSGQTVSGASISYANADLVNGNASSATNWTAPTTGDLQLYSGSIVIDSSHAPASSMSVTLSNIPYATYNVYVYFQGSKGTGTSPDLWSIQDSGTGLTYYWLGDQSGGEQQSLKTYVATTDQNSGTAAAANYAVFSELGGAGTSDTITIPNAYTNGAGAGVYGFQIVSTPEPASVAFLGAAALLPLLRRRRRQTV